ncbi:hypothetical protein [Streptomyces thermolilacinus]|uniref:hypothetical protein n=1 Tax=Streptomyces thermolilacinus TaxID=285540 RepID=UPI0033E4FC80
MSRVTNPGDREILAALTEGQFRGWSCTWCSEELDGAAEEVRRLEVYRGAHYVGTTLWACSRCLKAARTKHPPGQPSKDGAPT